MSQPQSPVFVPPEWNRHRAIWLAWPWNEDEWGEPLAGAQRCVAAFAVATAAAGEAVEFLMPPGDDLPLAALIDAGAKLTSEVPASGQIRTHALPYGDIWLRDTGPFFGVGREGTAEALLCAWNGWGGKYLMDGDAEIGKRIATIAGVPYSSNAWIMEGGSLDFDGAGRVLTTRECVLNPNRNPGWTEKVAEKALAEMFGVEQVVWLDKGLHHDHTDGHVDNIARFIAPGVAVAMRPSGADDPHTDRLLAIRADLEASLGRENVRVIPSPGLVTHPIDGSVLPASYMNFLIANEAVLVPVYGTPYDDAACRALGELFPGRRITPIRANYLLTGGGSLHCCSKEEALQ